MKKTETELVVVDLDKIDVNKLPELANFKERGLKLVKDCGFVEIVDNSTWEIAKKNRTALRTFRTDVEKSDKAIKSKLNNFKNRVGEVSASLIAITEPSEKKIQAEVERYEQIKENERLEKLRLEQERVDNIKKSIQEFANHWNAKISSLTFTDLDSFETELGEAFVNFDKSSLAEFEVLFDDQKVHIYAFFENIAHSLTEKENIRLEQLRLAEEREKQRIEAEKIAEAQRILREKFEAEQKAQAEKIRLAKEEFEKEKREFEEKQAEAKRIEDEKAKKFLEIEVVEDVKSEEIANENNLIPLKLVKLPNGETVWATKEGVEFLESTNDQEADTHEEATQGLSTRLKANTKVVEKEFTFRDVCLEYIDSIQGEDESSPYGFANYLDINYNCPTRKI